MVFSIENLSVALRPLSDEQGANASVAVLLKLKNGKLHVLFVKRAENSSDPWSGQMAFPGGKQEAKDKDLKETAVRETLEETRMNLLRNCRFLGVMPAFQTISKPEIKVLPFVILIEEEPAIHLNEKELEEYSWIPVEDLLRNRAKVKFSFGEFPAFIIGDAVIWGLTYRIVESLMDLFKA